MSIESDLRSRVAAIRWYHSIDLGNGVVTPGVDDTPQRLARVALPASFNGQSVLDIGAWDGFFSFEAERRGAARVLAADYYSWHGLGWSTGDGKAGFRLAREALQSKVEDVDLDVMQIDAQQIGTFDVVFFLGVLYHLKDPLGALERIAAVTSSLLILETVVDMVGISRPAAAFYPGTELNGDPTNWWAPNHAGVAALLTAAGFSRVDIITPPRSTLYRAVRAAWHVVRGKNGWTPAFRQDRAVFHAWKTPAGTAVRA